MIDDAIIDDDENFYSVKKLSMNKIMISEMITK